jgi:hypothetical protein
LNQGKIYSSDEEITFDILGEIEDDIDDLEEDRNTLNGNRFLEVLDSGDGMRIREYINFVSSFSDDHLEITQRILKKIDSITKHIT